MNAADIKNGVVVNVASVDSKEVADAFGYVLCGDAGIGWTYTDGVFSAPVTAALTVDQNIAAIKTKAGQLILARLPDYKQRNYLARKAELQDILLAGNTLSASEQAEWDFFAVEWAWAKAVRATSNDAEVAGTPVDEVAWPV